MELQETIQGINDALYSEPMVRDISDAIDAYNDHHKGCNVCSNHINVTLRIKCPQGATLLTEVVNAANLAGMATVQRV